MSQLLLSIIKCFAWEHVVPIRITLNQILPIS